MLRQSPASQGLDPSLPEVNEPAPDYVPPDAETGETLSPLAAFLTHAALESGDNQAQAGQDAMQLMTVHSAKGLEFDCVFISGLEEGLFPSERSMTDHEGLEEERRLMYVAITRARKRLYLSYSQTRLLHGQTRYNIKQPLLRGAARGRAEVAHAQEPELRRLGLRLRRGLRRPRAAAARPAASARTPSPARRCRCRRQRRRMACAPGMKVFHTKFGEGTVLSHRRAGRRCPGPGELPAARHQVAGAVGGQADAGALRVRQHVCAG